MHLKPPSRPCAGSIARSSTSIKHGKRHDSLTDATLRGALRSNDLESDRWALVEEYPAGAYQHYWTLRSLPSGSKPLLRAALK
jgi:hypothetical protein